MQGNSFKALKIVHSTLLAGLALLMIVAVVLVSQHMMKMPDKDHSPETAFQAVAGILSIACLLAGFTIFKKQLVAARDATPGLVRFDMYRSACILWWALLEGPGLFAIVAYLLTGNMVFVILALFHLGLLFVFTPRKDSIIVLLNLSAQDVQELEGATV